MTLRSLDIEYMMSMIEVMNIKPAPGKAGHQRQHRRQRPAKNRKNVEFEKLTILSCCWVGMIEAIDDMGSCQGCSGIMGIMHG